MKKLLLSCAIILTITQSRAETIAQKMESNVEVAADKVNTIWQNMEYMRQNVEDMFQDFGKQLKEEITDLQNLASNTWEKISSTDGTKSLRIHISEEDTNHIIITVDGITQPAQNEHFSANISYDTQDKPSKLVVVSEGQEITVVYKSKFSHIGVSVSQERTIKHHDEKGNIISQHQSMVSKSYGQTIAAEILLDEPTIDYVNEEQKLIIFLPKVIPTEKKKAISVNVR